jgi:hypothetical protein
LTRAYLFWLHRLEIEKRLIDIKDDQRKGGHLSRFHFSTSTMADTSA